MTPTATSAGRRLWLKLRPIWPTLPAKDLLRNPTYRRLWTSILISSFGGQVTMLALPLTAAVLLHATAWQMGVHTAMELAPFVLLSLPAGVWLDRVRKLPVYVVGEGIIALVLASVPLAWYLGWLSMSLMYGVAFAIGCVFVTAGTAAQIVLTQVVPRERLVEAHAKNALASSGAEVAGPGLAGALIKLVGAPLALLADALLLLVSVLILRGLHVHEQRSATGETHFWRDLKEGLRFVVRDRLLVSLAVAVGLWQMCHQCAMVVQILFATRVLGLSANQVGFCYMGLGLGSVLASIVGNRISQRLGPGPCLDPGFCGVRPGLAAIGAGAAGCLGRGLFCFHAAVFQRRCRADLYQLSGAAPGRYTRAFVGAYDQHHALADLDTGRAGRLVGRLPGRAPGPALRHGVRGRRFSGAGAVGLAPSGVAQCAGVADGALKVCLLYTSDAADE